MFTQKGTNEIWSDWNEWRQLKADLWSGDNSRIDKALGKVRHDWKTPCVSRGVEIWDWSLVCCVPMEIEVTAALFKAECSAEITGADPMILEALYATPLIRLTAALRDNSEALRLRPGSELPLSVGLARNNYVHDQKPTLEHLRLVSKTAMDFIKKNYWDYVEEGIPSQESLVEFVHILFSDEASDVGKSECLEKLVSSLDSDQLCTLLLDHVTIPSITLPKGIGIQHGLLSICERCGQLWLVYLAESWIERARLPAITKSQTTSAELLSSIQSWGSVIGYTLPSVSVSMETVERERIIQKTMDLLKMLVESPGPSLERESVLSLVDATEKIFDWATDQVRHAQTKQRLCSIVQLLLRQLKTQPLNQKPKDASTTDRQTTEKEDIQCGVFTKVDAWDSCAIGSLPFNSTCTIDIHE